ncbi:hypothetical protein FACS1894116_01380 [Betaproteobacteria bacterium]|nr:hypothetical protein FACS1894116_01380 [Betaproteobacteria bacterium]GHU24920.1 hypothetical protein FACS189488_10640 [Betaproteobacteria bacterium]GHU28447.1 hypothetical protein FACS189497_03920 [Betaproteobacteria bacterium]
MKLSKFAKHIHEIERLVLFRWAEGSGFELWAYVYDGSGLAWESRVLKDSSGKTLIFASVDEGYRFIERSGFAGEVVIDSVRQKGVKRA